MKRTLFLPGVALLMFAGAAHAQTYAGISVGATFPEDSRNRGTTTSAIPATAAFPAIPAGTAVDWRTEFNTGFNLAGQIGHRFDNGLRIEAELAWTRASVDRHRNMLVGGANIDGANLAILTRGTSVPGGPTVGAALSTDPGRVDTIGAFGNIFYDFNRSGKLQPYVGAGLGFQHVIVDYRPSNTPVADGTDTRFAYQLMAGATYKLSPRTELFGQYTWREADGRAQVRNLLVPATLGVQSRQSIVSAGVRFGF